MYRVYFWFLLRNFTRNDASQAQLMNHCKAVAEQISSLVQAVRSSMTSQDNPSAQLGLINSSQAMIPVCVSVAMICTYCILISQYIENEFIIVCTVHASCTCIVSFHPLLTGVRSTYS